MNNQKLECENYVNDAGNPTGGFASAAGLAIHWQDGPLAVDGVRKEPSGAFVETVLRAAVDRLEFYQTASGGRFAHNCNEAALKDLKCALMHLEMRTKEREARGVEGSHVV